MLDRDTAPRKRPSPSLSGKSIRSGLITEDDLAPAAPAPAHADEVPRAEVEEVMQEQGEELANENDPIVEFAPEPDAETEPRASQEVQPSADVPNSTGPQTKETALLRYLPATQCPLFRQCFLPNPQAP